MRLIVRLAFLLVVLVLLAAGGGLAWFSSWRAERIAHLNSASSIAGTPAGNVEFLQEGDGPAVLVFHGTPGGYDQAMLFGSSLAEQGFQIIAPSRPGYLRTPLTSGLTPEKQADAMAALLDTLGLENVAVLGVSLGAPAAIEFCIRYPKRAWALVLISAVTKKSAPGPSDPPFPKLLNERLTGDVGSWFLVHTSKADPAKALGWCFDLAQKGEESARMKWIQCVLGDAGQVSWFQDLASTVAPISPRETGLKNDLLQLKALPDFGFDKLTVPTLLIHGAEDSFVPLAEIEAVKARMPNAELLAIPGAGHIPELGPDSAALPDRIKEFLGRFHGGQGTP
ncbi:MAG: alpha/beta hydrolase [Verrucomicrobia bacterium]|nr:alpha/beta hydrolase [Verrucomicrobiota bacterium]